MLANFGGNRYSKTWAGPSSSQRGQLFDIPCDVAFILGGKGRSLLLILYMKELECLCTVRQVQVASAVAKECLHAMKESLWAPDIIRR
jgi:hypothetical protein